MKLGIVGQGYVGTAVKEIMSKYYDVETFDIDKNKRTCETLQELVNITDIIFYDLIFYYILFSKILFFVLSYIHH